MAYISSDSSRVYCALESEFGKAPAITAQERLAAIELKADRTREGARRRDKTGSRTNPGVPDGGRTRTTFSLSAYLGSWPAPVAPAYGPLIQAAMGAAPLTFAGGAAGEGSAGSTVVFASPHGLVARQAVSHGGEIRFVTATPSATTVELNAPFSAPPTAGQTLPATITYRLSTALPSVTLFEYWSPGGALQRLLCGAAVDEFEIRVNGDYHEFGFSGVAQDLIDSASFAAGQAGLSAFPVEPATGAFAPVVVPGNLGQAWIGATPERFLTITAANFAVRNGLETRSREFGSRTPRGVAPGRRTVAASLKLFEQDDNASRGLCQAARSCTPTSIMFQLGEQAGKLCGVYLKEVVPEPPRFDDSDTRLQWEFRDCAAQGAGDDEVVVAFG